MTEELIEFEIQITDKASYVRPADLNDWENLKALLQRLRGTKAVNYISSTKEEMRAFLVNSITYPQQVCLLVNYYLGHLVGVAAMMVVDTPMLGRIGVMGPVAERYCFIHAVYMDRHLPGDKTREGRIPHEVSSEFCRSMVEWGQRHGAIYMFGNVRLNGNFRAFEKLYGFKRQHVVVGRWINGQQ